MKIIRNYLTSEEISFIVNSMLEKNSAIEQEIVKVGLILQFIGDDLGDFEDCNVLYDEFIKTDISLEDSIKNYKTIDRLFKQETSIEKILKEFLDSTGEEIKKSLSKMDINGAIKQLEEIAKNGNDTNTQKRKSKNI